MTTLLIVNLLVSVLNLSLLVPLAAAVVRLASPAAEDPAPEPASGLVDPPPAMGAPWNMLPAPSARLDRHRDF